MIKYNTETSYKIIGKGIDDLFIECYDFEVTCNGGYTKLSEYPHHSIPVPTHYKFYSHHTDKSKIKTYASFNAECVRGVVDSYYLLTIPVVTSNIINDTIFKIVLKDETSYIIYLHGNWYDIVTNAYGFSNYVFYAGTSDENNIRIIGVFNYNDVTYVEQVTK